MTDKTDFGWITIGENKTHVEVDAKGNIKSGPASLKGDSLNSLSDKSRNPIRQAKAAHARVEGKTGRDYSTKEAQSLGNDKKVAQHQAARAAAKIGVSVHSVLELMPEAHRHLTEVHQGREAAKETARKLTGLNAGQIAKLENTYHDHSTRVGFDTASRTIAVDHPELGFDPDSTDTPGKVWDLIREGKQDPPALHSREVAETAAEWAKGSKPAKRSKKVSAWGDSLAEDWDDETPFGAAMNEQQIFGSPDQPRDDHGRFASGGGGGDGSSIERNIGDRLKTSDPKSTATHSALVASSRALSASKLAGNGNKKDHYAAHIEHAKAGAHHVANVYNKVGDVAEAQKLVDYHAKQSQEHWKAYQSNFGSAVRSMPSESLKFGGEVLLEAGEIAATAGGMPQKPITIRARTANIGYQKYWGRCVHDMAGFRNPGKPIPLDWNHDSSDEIGVADRVDVVDGELVAFARLVPFKPDDSAARVIYRGASGIPYQASIVMSLDGLQVEEVADGEIVQVNGQDFAGPGAIFRQWGIDGIAVTPYGSDSHTSVQFAGKSPAVDVVFLTPVKDVATMVAPVVAAGKPAAIESPAEIPAEKQNFSREMALKFKTDFGAAGFDWYLEGKSYEEAARLFSASQQKRIEDLEANHTAAMTAKDELIAKLTSERDSFKAKAEFGRGKATPVPVKPTSEEEANPDEKQNFSMTSGRAALTASILKRMPSSTRIPNVSPN